MKVAQTLGVQVEPGLSDVPASMGEERCQLQQKEEGRCVRLDWKRWRYKVTLPLLRGCKNVAWAAMGETDRREEREGGRNTVFQMSIRIWPQSSIYFHTIQKLNKASWICSCALEKPWSKTISNSAHCRHFVTCPSHLISIIQVPHCIDKAVPDAQSTHGFHTAYITFVKTQGTCSDSWRILFSTGKVLCFWVTLCSTFSSSHLFAVWRRNVNGLPLIRTSSHLFDHQESRKIHAGIH